MNLPGRRQAEDLSLHQKSGFESRRETRQGLRAEAQDSIGVRNPHLPIMMIPGTRQPQRQYEKSCQYQSPNNRMAEVLIVDEFSPVGLIFASAIATHLLGRYQEQKVFAGPCAGNHLKRNRNYTPRLP